MSRYWMTQQWMAFVLLLYGMTADWEWWALVLPMVWFSISGFGLASSGERDDKRPAGINWILDSRR